MAFDFKKEYKEFYMPKNTPEIVTVPAANYIAVRGQGANLKNRLCVKIACAGSCAACVTIPVLN